MSRCTELLHSIIVFPLSSLDEILFLLSPIFTVSIEVLGVHLLLQSIMKYLEGFITLL